MTNLDNKQYTCAKERCSSYIDIMFETGCGGGNKGPIKIAKNEYCPFPEKHPDYKNNCKEDKTK